MGDRAGHEFYGNQYGGGGGSGDKGGGKGPSHNAKQAEALTAHMQQAQATLKEVNSHALEHEFGTPAYSEQSKAMEAAHTAAAMATHMAAKASVAAGRALPGMNKATTSFLAKNKPYTTAQLKKIERDQER